MVDDIKISPQQVDGDLYVTLTADLSIGNVQLPNAGIPILLPKSGKEIGLLTLQRTADGRNQIEVDLNVSETANLDLERVTLPNGGSLPLIADNPVLVIPVGKGVDVYLSLSETNAAIGIAIPIKAFDKIGKEVGTASLMPMFNKNNILGAAGVYTSKTPGLNGFALVADLTTVIDRNTAQEVLAQNILIQQEVSNEPANLAIPSARQEKKINKGLLRLHKARTRLQLN